MSKPRIAERVAAKTEYMREYRRKNYGSLLSSYEKPKAKRSGEAAGLRNCLKCDKEFKSPDKIRIRICGNCHEINKGLSHLEGVDDY